jgi:ATP/maltotriose-dependent transcriptional regulator MalT
MGTTTPTLRPTRSLQRRRIIERPRLLELLDESDARIKTLIAPAGYGKTTLAEQWVGREGTTSAWYTVRRSSVDVAALALGVARASTAVVDDCDSRLREHLRAVSAAGNVALLAEILGEDLAEWPDDGWLVLDDYQELASAEDAESFVGSLIANCPVQIVVASRQRPSWVTTRSILYGEVLEINQTALAMDTHEAEEVLAGWSGPSASGLVAVANGWPAVIGLAGVSSAEIESEDALPESLYQFFAEEVFDALGEDVRAGVAALAIAPVIDWELARSLLGSERADAVCSAALEVGILVERDTRLDLHPLARSFLEERKVIVDLAPEDDLVHRCLAHYRRHRDWDAAFDVIARRQRAEELAPLLLEALDDLLETARLSTVEAWCDFASQAGLNAPPFSLARAEVALRQGRHAQAQAFAEAAASEPVLSFRSLFVAGRAAHLASREENARDLFRRAEAAASSRSDRRDTLWSQLLCEIELELPVAAETLARLREGVRASDPRDVVRAAICSLSYQVRFGQLDVSDAEVAFELLRSVDDPLVESSFLSGYAYVLALSALYEEALQASSSLLAIAQRYRLDFAIPYARLAAAIAHAGLREWQRADHCLDEAETHARASRNSHAEHGAYAVRLRVLAQQGRQEAALAHPLPDLSLSLPESRGEVFASRGLVLATADRLDVAADLVDGIRGSTRAIEPSVLIPAVDAIISLKRREPAALGEVAKFASGAFASGAVDLLVAAYRSYPDVLAVVLRSPLASQIREVVRRVRDDDLAQHLGLPSSAEDDPRVRLSPREREVYELLAQGLGNRQIAALLFIEESTVKVHVHHIYDKLGVRSRTALAVQAALKRSDQATSATGEIDSGTAS